MKPTNTELAKKDINYPVLLIITGCAILTIMIMTIPFIILHN